MWNDGKWRRQSQWDWGGETGRNNYPIHEIMEGITHYNKWTWCLMNITFVHMAMTPDDQFFQNEKSNGSHEDCA